MRLSYKGFKLLFSEVIFVIARNRKLNVTDFHERHKLVAFHVVRYE